MEPADQAAIRAIGGLGEPRWFVVKKRLNGEGYYFVADARTGEPVPGARMELFGYRQRHLDKNRYEVNTL